LNFIGVYDSPNVSISDYSGRDSESRLLVAISLSCSKDVIEFFKSTLSPDDKSANMTSRSKLEEVKSINIAEINTLDVTEGAGEGLVTSLFVVDKKRSSTLYIASVTGLTLTTSDSFGGSHSLQLVRYSESLEKSNSILSFRDGINISISYNQGNFSYSLNSVATSQNEWSKSRSR
jgi:hypothetical protein